MCVYMCLGFVSFVCSLSGPRVFGFSVIYVYTFHSQASISPSSQLSTKSPHSNPTPFPSNEQKEKPSEKEQAVWCILFHEFMCLLNSSLRMTLRRTMTQKTAIADRGDVDADDDDFMELATPQPRVSHMHSVRSDRPQSLMRILRSLLDVKECQNAEKRKICVAFRPRWITRPQTSQ